MGYISVFFYPRALDKKYLIWIFCFIYHLYHLQFNIGIFIGIFVGYFFRYLAPSHHTLHRWEAISSIHQLSSSVNGFISIDCAGKTVPFQAAGLYEKFIAHNFVFHKHAFIQPIPFFVTALIFCEFGHTIWFHICRIFLLFVF